MRCKQRKTRGLPAIINTRIETSKIPAKPGLQQRILIAISLSPLSTLQRQGSLLFPLSYFRFRPSPPPLGSDLLLLLLLPDHVVFFRDRVVFFRDELSSSLSAKSCGVLRPEFSGPTQKIKIGSPTLVFFDALHGRSKTTESTILKIILTLIACDDEEKMRGAFIARAKRCVGKMRRRSKATVACTSPSRAVQRGGG